MTERTRSIIHGSCVALAILILIIVLAVTRIVGQAELDKVRDAIIEDVFEGRTGDYVIHVDKCEALSTDHPHATYYIAQIYTGEDGMQTVIAREEDGFIEVYDGLS